MTINKGGVWMIKGIVLLLAAGVLLSGCWGKREVEQLSPLIAVGIDRGKTPGKFLVTEQYALPVKGATTAADVEGWTYSYEASTAREINEMTSKMMNRLPFWGSLKVIVIGEEAGKDGFMDILDYVQRFPEFRRSTYIILARGSAREVLNAKLRSGDLPAMFIKDNIETVHTASVFPVVHFGHFLALLSNKHSAQILPVVEMLESGVGGIEYETEPGAGTHELRIQGSGVFREDRLISYLSDEETKGYLWLEDKIKTAILKTVNIGESPVNFTGHIQRTKTNHRVKNFDGTLGLAYHIKVSAAVDEIIGLEEQLSPEAWIDLMNEAERMFAKSIERECNLAIQREKELGLDFLLIGRHIEQQRPRYWKTVKDQWDQEIANFPVSVSVEVKISNSGMSSNGITSN